MSAAASAHLALVPPGPAAPLSEMTAKIARTGGRVARARRVMLGAWFTGCALIVLGLLLAPSTDGLSFVAVVLAGIFVLPVSGLAHFGLAVYERTLEARSSLIFPPLALVSTLILAGPARHAGIELHLAANQVELDALAAEIRAASAGVPGTSDGWADGRIPLRFHDRLQPFGLRSLGPVDGGLLFRRNGDLGYTLLYADGAAGPPWACEKVRLRFLGGRWYRYDCLDPTNYD